MRGYEQTSLTTHAAFRPPERIQSSNNGHFLFAPASSPLRLLTVGYVTRAMLNVSLQADETTKLYAMLGFKTPIETGHLYLIF
jgi:hypothetical protein